MSFTLDTFRYLNIHTENFINVQGKCATTEKKKWLLRASSVT